jgi:hypothetical protein
VGRGFSHDINDGKSMRLKAAGSWTEE